MLLSAKGNRSEIINSLSRKKGGSESFYTLFLLERIGTEIMTPMMLINSHPGERLGMVLLSVVSPVNDSISSNLKIDISEPLVEMEPDINSSFSSTPVCLFH